MENEKRNKRSEVEIPVCTLEGVCSSQTFYGIKDLEKLGIPIKTERKKPERQWVQHPNIHIEIQKHIKDNFRYRARITLSGKFPMIEPKDITFEFSNIYDGLHLLGRILTALTWQQTIPTVVEV